MRNLSILVAVLLLSACGVETIPPAAKGKILSTSGYEKEVHPSGRIFLFGFDKLIVLHTNTNTHKETVKVILQDKLTLKADVRFQGRISGDSKVINTMFNDIVPDGKGAISFSMVYNIYGRPAVRNITREILSQYSVEDIHKNYGRLSGQIGAALSEALKNTPLEISEIALGNIAYPDVVTQAVEAAKERELAIKKEQAQAEIELTKKKNERLLAEADYQIKITRAKAIRDENKIIGEGVTPELLKLKQLEVQEAMAKAMSTNGNSSVFIPYEALNTTGAQMRVFSEKR